MNLTKPHLYFMEFLKQFVNTFHKLSEDSYSKFEKLTSKQNLKKNQLLVSTGEVPTNISILKSGIVRAFLLNESGKEHTRTLYTGPTTIGNLSSLITKEPSKLIFECLTDCEFMQCNYDEFYKLSTLNHDVSILHHKILEGVYIREESRILELSSLSSKEKYLKLLEKSPTINQDINQYHIASYLNITPVQLSRIKKNLLKA